MSQTAYAQGFTILGAGTASCGKWTENLADRDIDSIFISWILGYLSAYDENSAAFSRPDFLSGRDYAGIAAWARNYCLAHPLDTILKAASMLRQELSR
jgi:hypothetical protein